ncbi:Cytochrome c551 peroxidase [hydrothermal vent metagenome]|uniref:Cytochrome c551 peroxidase n=1 Tax=hydrothermal vent metagenome TaxID=652676 RepID=A0A1W1CIA9_9ZZZZ
MKKWLSFIIFALSTMLFAIDLVPIPMVSYKISPKVLLGKALFSDSILSQNKKVSCLSCHNIYKNGADNIAFSEGIYGQSTHFNTPTVYNAVYNFRQFWDGRAKDLREQALLPIENTMEMNNTIEQVIKDLKASKEYLARFSSIYEEGITANNIADALVAFESILVTPSSAFDKYLRGDKKAISKEAIEGYRIFKEKGCISCHYGINIGGNLYNKFGIYEEVKSKELGRYNITGKERDKYVFKVPSLRNIARTAPYMHDGRVSTLKKAINLMSRYQLGQEMEEVELHAVFEFLKTLNGEIPNSIKDNHASQN